MSASRQTVRVFISSTFRDMHAERDHLVTVVFPELRERVEQLGLEFFDVDLRWGVPAKDANGETANSWEYCRQWIDRVEPFFVCILGQRYAGAGPIEGQRRSPAAAGRAAFDHRHGSAPCGAQHKAEAPQLRLPARDRQRRSIRRWPEPPTQQKTQIRVLDSGRGQAQNYQNEC